MKTLDVWGDHNKALFSVIQNYAEYKISWTLPEREKVFFLGSLAMRKLLAYEKDLKSLFKPLNLELGFQEHFFITHENPTQNIREFYRKIIMQHFEGKPYSQLSDELVAYRLKLIGLENLGEIYNDQFWQLSIGLHQVYESFLALPLEKKHALEMIASFLFEDSLSLAKNENHLRYLLINLFFPVFACKKSDLLSFYKDKGVSILEQSGVENKIYQESRGMNWLKGVWKEGESESCHVKIRLNELGTNESLSAQALGLNFRSSIDQSPFYPMEVFPNKKPLFFKSKRKIIDREMDYMKL